MALLSGDQGAATAERSLNAHSGVTDHSLIATPKNTRISSVLAPFAGCPVPRMITYVVEPASAHVRMPKLVTARRLVKAAFLRVTLNHVTLSFFLLSFTFCILQGLIQTFLWNDDNTASTDVNSILEKGNVPLGAVPWLTVHGDDYNLKICSVSPVAPNDPSQVCRTLYDSATPNATWALPQGLTPDGTKSNISVTVSDGTNSVSLSEQCAWTLLYPSYKLEKSMDEALALLFSHIWLLGISSAAILSQSTSHVIAVFSMRVLSTAWSAYTIWRTKALQATIANIIGGPNTPCQLDNYLVKDYFQIRIAFQIPDLILNVCGLVFTGILGWKLLKRFREHVFNCAGPPAHIIRIYRLMLTVLVLVQILLYLGITSISLAVKEAVVTRTTLLGFFITAYVVTVVAIVSVAVLAHRAIRYEHKQFMILLLIILVCLTLATCGLYIPPAFRFTWLEWPFFACTFVLSTATLIASIVFAVLCRTHFGEGLSHYLYVEQVLSDNEFEPDGFSTEVDKVSFDVKNPSYLVQEAMPKSPVLTRDSNWDFENRERPRIYTVELA
ncbi:hypothetical protein BDW22DRAFT_1432068 [Trametopsis cervina]|nr:hypothetical protein BDW22DRAFT_1432068 [Trametopsis cervina]